ncbi:MAG TPA: Ig-like domain-containing protein [Gemmatimonadaceae bacterium]|nr:Ig-like domain-containing protein [Gemmatimonadaceae bacterium]
MRTLSVKLLLPVSIGLVVGGVACGSKGTTDPADGQPPPLTITAPATSIKSGSTLQATVTTSTGGPVTAPMWRSSDDNVASVTSDGLITGKKAGNALITAQSGASYGSYSVHVVPGDAVGLLIYAGNGQIGAVNSALRDPLCTNVVDAAGNYIVGEHVTYTVATGGGSMQPPATVVTDASGIATSGLWLLGPSTGEQTVTATAKAASGETMTVTFKATAQ